MMIAGIPAEVWLPLVFAGLMGLSMLIYAVLDGYDLGVGILLRHGTKPEKDRMIGSIGPFWDANETWLVLGVGLLLVAFPKAHGLILTGLYLPVAFMLIGLILRGVAFDFRAKAKSAHKAAWDRVFWAGSLLASFAQGYMLGSYILGLEQSLSAVIFSLLVGCALVAGYALVGACWLIMKTEGELQQKAVRWARYALWVTLLGILLVSLATPLVSERIFAKWFSFPALAFLAPVPLVTLALIVVLERLLRRLPAPQDRGSRLPFFLTIGIFMLSFGGLAYSFYPYIVPERLTIFEAASAPESLMIILAGALLVLPFLVFYTALAYYIFRGKAQDLYYD